MAEDVVDRILEAGAKHEYEKYIEPKVKPFLVDDINNEQAHLNQMHNPPNDNGEREFREWRSDEEPDAAKLPQTVAGGVKIRYREPAIFQTGGDGSLSASKLSMHSSPRIMKRSGSSRRNMFQASPGKKFAASMLMDPVPVSIGS